MACKKTYASSGKNMSIDRDTIAKIARLARLKFESEDLATLEPDLNKILGWVEDLQQIQTDGIEPLNNPQEGTTPLRQDEVTDGGIKEKVLSNAPDKAHDMFAVPKVVE